FDRSVESPRFQLIAYPLGVALIGGGADVMRFGRKRTHTLFDPLRLGNRAKLLFPARFVVVLGRAGRLRGRIDYNKYRDGQSQCAISDSGSHMFSSVIRFRIVGS